MRSVSEDWQVNWRLIFLSPCHGLIMLGPNFWECGWQRWFRQSSGYWLELFWFRDRWVFGQNLETSPCSSFQQASCCGGILACNSSHPHWPAILGLLSHWVWAHGCSSFSFGWFQLLLSRNRWESMSPTRHLWHLIKSKRRLICSVQMASTNCSWKQDYLRGANPTSLQFQSGLLPYPGLLFQHGFSAIESNIYGLETGNCNEFRVA